MGGRADVEILGLPAEQQVANAAADEVGDVVGLAEPVQDLERVRVDVAGARPCARRAGRSSALPSADIVTIRRRANIGRMRPFLLCACAARGRRLRRRRLRPILSRELECSTTSASSTRRSRRPTRRVSAPRAPTAPTWLRPARISRNFARATVPADLVERRANACGASPPSTLRRTNAPSSSSVLGRSCISIEAAGAAAELFDSLLTAPPDQARTRAGRARARARLVGQRARSRGAAAAGDRASGDLPAHPRSHARRARDDAGERAASTGLRPQRSRRATRRPRGTRRWPDGCARRSSPDQGAALRGDLDALVERGIIPERARLLAQPPRRVQAEWETFKSQVGEVAAQPGVLRSSRLSSSRRSPRPR